MKLGGMFATLFLFAFFSSHGLAQNEARLLRFPATNGDQIVFTYAGNLYTVSAAGGEARKLTNDEGFEMFARFSPDGERLAFTAQYDGNTEVYLMPADGGTPTRLTYSATLGRDDVSDRMGPNNIVTTWRDDETIVYRSRWREFNSFKGQLYAVNVEGGMPEQLPFPEGGFCSYSPDGSKLALNQVFREFRTWKRYRGGMADEIWIYDFGSKTIESVTDNDAQDIIPMWSGEKIYFLSDRDGRMNLYSYDLASGETVKRTNFDEFDVKWASLGGGKIVFENGGYLYLYDTATDQAEKVTVFLNEDFAIGRGGLTATKDYITTYEIAPNGGRALITARGEIFSLPAEHGAVRNLTRTSGVHERNAKYSPDGKSIAYLSDESGEFEIYVRPTDRSKPARKITENAGTYYFDFKWSPDGKKIAWHDKLLRLQFVDVESGQITLVEKADAWEITSYEWSPDSKWLVFAKPMREQMTTLYLYSLDSKKTTPLSDGFQHCYGATFSDDGDFLYYIADRAFEPTYSWTEWNTSYQDMAKLYVVMLEEGTKSPFAPKSDEATGEEKQEEKNDDESVTVSIDIEGVMTRAEAIPVEAGRYGHLTSVGNKLFYQRQKAGDEKAALYSYDFEKQEEKSHGKIDGYEPSLDNKKMLVKQGDKYAVIDVPAAEIKIEKTLATNDMKMDLDRKAEWRQIFDECHRHMRDFLYAPNMHGVDWEATRATYEPLVAYVNHRADLSYVVGEMIGELNIGHAYVGGGDYPKADRVKLGLLGAEFEKDAESGYFRVVKILDGLNWESDLRSPLAVPGVGVEEGDYIFSINGVPTNETNNIYEALIDRAGKQTTLEVGDSPDPNKSRETVVEPIADEHALYYFNWVERNREIVDSVSDGKVGYIHIPDMGKTGLNQFVKYFYPQIRKAALVIDVRGNGGGNVSPMIIERLRREMVMTDMARNVSPSPDPSASHIGPQVCLLDKYSASDGDLFPFRFRAHKLGKLVGERSWGGVVGIRGTLPIVDGGYLMRPEFAPYSVKGDKWVIEGYGVDPDVYVSNDPTEEFEGTDRQLLKAVEVVLEDLKNADVELPAPPPFPDKNIK